MCAALPRLYDKTMQLAGRSLLALTLLGSTVAHALTVTVVATTSDELPSDRAVAAHLLAAGSDAETTVEMTVPGRTTIELEPGEWRFQLNAPGYWAAPLSRQLDGKAAEVELALWPTGQLTSRCVIQGAKDQPASLSLRFQRSPGSEDGPETGRMACPLQEGELRYELPAGRHDLRFKAAGYVSHFLWGVRVKAGEERATGPISLRKGSAVLGWVECEGRGAIDGVEISLAPRSAGQHRRRSSRQRMRSLETQVRSNDRGFFIFAGIAPGEYIITARHEPFAPASATVRVLESKETVITDPPLMLRRPEVLELVVDPPITPFGEQWSVRLTQVDGSGQTIKQIAADRLTASGGWVSPAIPQGRFHLVVGPDQDTVWAERYLDVTLAMPPVFLEVPVVEIRGSVMLGDDPLPATLWFGGKHGAVSVVLEADEEGRFHGHLPRPGEWEVAVEGIEASVSRSLQQVEVEPRPGKSYAEVELVLPATHLLVTVVDTNDRAVSGAIVTAQSRGGLTMPVRQRTGADGEAELRGLPPGEVSAVAEATIDDTPLSSETVLLQLESKVTARVALRVRPELKVRGRVVAGAAGVPGATVKLEPCQASGKPVFVETTNVDGYFETALSAETKEVMVTVAAPGFALQLFRAAADPDQLLAIPVSQVGGALLIELPQDLDQRRWGAPGVFLVHRGAVEGAAYLVGWAQLRGQQQEGHRIRLPDLEPGEYQACLVRSMDRLALLSGAGPAHACGGGYLAPHGELVISLAEASIALAEQTP